ncbi:cysteine hydrolase family protein [Streptomyces sp. NPDC001822]|uniref:cysteine hydrolase family protein n=1 Tax=Streptomyces sp. NPDC001822 TaxID=3364614 RepID=UPI0036B3BFCC
MSETYDPRHTAVLLVDPYNDFISEGGLNWDRLSPVALDVGLVDHLRNVVAAARGAGVRVVFVPHRRWQPGDYDTWSYPNPTHRAIQKKHSFALGTWGGEFHPDFQPQEGELVAHEHWSQSGFANTDLNLLLQQHDISHVVLIGVLANTCIESTGRFAMELGYHVTLVRDATAAFSPEMMHAAHELNGPTFAHSIVTTEEIVSVLKELTGSA